MFALKRKMWKVSCSLRWFDHSDRLLKQSLAVRGSCLTPNLNSTDLSSRPGGEASYHLTSGRGPLVFQPLISPELLLLHSITENSLIMKMLLNILTHLCTPIALCVKDNNTPDLLMVTCES